MLNRFEAIKDCLKTFEIRKNDRNYKVGDTLVLHPVDSDNNVIHSFGYEPIHCDIVYIDDYEQKDDYVVLGICY